MEPHERGEQIRKRYRKSEKAIKMKDCWHLPTLRKEVKLLVIECQHLLQNKRWISWPLFDESSSLLLTFVSKIPSKMGPSKKKLLSSDGLYILHLHEQLEFLHCRQNYLRLLLLAFLSRCTIQRVWILYPLKLNCWPSTRWDLQTKLIPSSKKPWSIRHRLRERVTTTTHRSLAQLWLSSSSDFILTRNTHDSLTS